jgi:hypothetical protein
MRRSDAGVAAQPSSASSLAADSGYIDNWVVARTNRATQALNRRITAPLLVKPTAGQRCQSINSSYSIVPTIVVSDHEAGLIIENHRAPVGTTLEIEHAEN